MNRAGNGLISAALVPSGLALLVSLVIYNSRPRGEGGSAPSPAPPVKVSLSMVVATF